MKRLLFALVLLPLSAFAQGTITHIIYINKENRSTDELFGTFPGVQNYCQGGNSPKRCTNNQATSCTTIGTHDVCGNAGWCEPIICTTPTGAECTAGDTCPQITTYQSGSGVNLLLEDQNTVYGDTGHNQSNFITQFHSGAMSGWPNNDNTGNSPTLHYFDSTKIPYYYLLANTYGLADNHFSTMGGPSLPNHLYMFAVAVGTGDGGISDNSSTTAAGNGSPGENPQFTSAWGCGALHTGSGVPYLYSSTLPATQASDGTKYYAGTRPADRTIACVCKCATGTKCGNTFDPTRGGSACTDTTGNTSAGTSCDTTFSLGGSTGSICPAVTTIADQAEAASVTWGYYSYNNNWNAASYVPNLYFNSSRWTSHVHHDTQFDTDVANCTGMCSNNHATACSVNATCGAGTCIDSDGTPAGSQICSLPKVVYLSADSFTSSEHPGGTSTMSAGETWTKNRLTPYFANSYIYNHSAVLITWDDWGGTYDHVPPPVQDSVPTLGFRVPLLCIGPYCRNKVTHTQFEFASELKCMEAAFGLTAINSRDAGATDACAGSGTLSSNTDGMVNLSQSPIPAIGAQTFNQTTLQNITLGTGASIQ